MLTLHVVGIVIIAVAGALALFGVVVFIYRRKKLKQMLLDKTQPSISNTNKVN